ncbi:S8/S53 family peptidase [Bacillus safensis]
MDKDGQQLNNKQVSVLVELRAKETQNEFARSESNMLLDEIEIDETTFQLDTSFKPILMSREDNKEGVESTITATEAVPTLLVRGMVSKDKIENLKRQENIIDVFPNPKGVIIPMAEPVDCQPNQPKGTLSEVAQFLGADKIWENGIKGNDIIVGIVDSGITSEGRADQNEWNIPFVNNVVDGFREDWGTYTDKDSFHGNMTATDVLGIAPQAKIHDIRIFSKEGIKETFVDIVIQAYDWAIRKFLNTGQPKILSNSWGFIGAVPGLTDDPNHPMNRKILEAVRAGILVLFSAGNCGDPCGSDNPNSCITKGPGESIHGINGHSMIITVGAANILGIRAGYSAQGPANFDPLKPDFCAPTHFSGYHRSDTGTSAACPIAAGVISLLKQAKPKLTQEQAKSALKSTATDLEELGWDSDTGAGIIQAYNAFKHITSQ